MSGSEQFDFHDFPEEEYLARYERSRELMEKEGVDLLVATDQTNCRYFSGFQGRTINRPVFFLLPLEGEPILLPSKDLGTRDARRKSWVKEIQDYELPVTADPICKAVKSLRKKPRRVGMEIEDSFFGGFRPALSYGGFKKLSDAFPEIEFHDASRLIWELRIIKTKREIESIEQACRILRKAYGDLFPTLRIGMTEQEIAASLLKRIIDRGGDLPDIGNQGPSAMIIINASRPADQAHIATKRPLQKGDLLRVDSGAVFKGYYSDFARSGTVGRPSPDQQMRWNTAVEKVNEALEKVRPGIRGDEIAVHWHGVGLNYVEAPFRGMMGKGIHGDLEIRPGMTLCLEEVIVAPNGETSHFEEVIEITGQGYRNLSCAERNLVII